jgi:hypothetical protein
VPGNTEHERCRRPPRPSILEPARRHFRVRVG